MMIMMMTKISIMMMKNTWYQYLCRVTTSRPRLLLITGEPDCARAQFNRNPPRLFFITNQSQMVTLLYGSTTLGGILCTMFIAKHDVLCIIYAQCACLVVWFHLLCPSSRTSNTLIWFHIPEFVDTHPRFFFTVLDNTNSLVHEIITVLHRIM